MSFRAQPQWTSRCFSPAVMQGRLLDIKGEMMPALAEEVIALSEGCDPAVAANAQRITAELRREETKFGSTLEAGTVHAALSSCIALSPQCSIQTCSPSLESSCATLSASL